MKYPTIRITSMIVLATLVSGFDAQSFLSEQYMLYPTINQIISSPQITANKIAEKVSLFSQALFRTQIFARLKVLLDSHITKNMIIHSLTMIPQPFGLLLISITRNVTIIKRIMMSMQNSIHILVTSLSIYSWRIYPNSFWSPMVLRDMEPSLRPESPEALLLPLAFLRRLRSFYIAINAISSSSFLSSLISG